MNRLNLIAHAVSRNKMATLAGMLVFSAVQLSSANAADMSRDQYSAAKDQIESAYKSDKAACDAMTGNAKDVCVEEAKGKEKVAKSDLEYRYSGKESDRTKMNTTKADAEYSVAKERCDDHQGNAKDVCVKQAKATHEKALADAKLSSKNADARQEASEVYVDADYKVAIQKCSGLAENEHSECVEKARLRYKK